MPTEMIKNDISQMSNLMTDSADQIDNTTSDLTFGEITWMGVITTPVIDLRPFEDSLAILRRIMQISLWCEFFYFIVLILRPRLTV
jgi:hypothetical protein